MVEVIFLGVGAALPMRGQTNSSYLVRAGGKVLLVDCGPAVLQQLDAVGVSPGEITHLFVTHRHGDHALGYPLLMLWLISTIRTAEKFPTVLANETTWKGLDTLLRNSFGEVVKYAENTPHLVFGDTEQATLDLGSDLRLFTWPMDHSRFAPDSGVRIECEGKVLAFTGDTAPCHNVLPLARGAELLVHDATHSATLNPELPENAHGHSNARSAAHHAAQATVKHLALVHIAAGYEGRQDVLVAEAAAEFAGQVTAPTAGTRLRF